MSTDEYKRLFPGAPITALSDKEKTSKNSGKHMKEDKYRKMFSEMFVGDKNPNHTSNATNEQRKSRSPFSKSFTAYETIDNKEEHISKFVKESIKDRISDTTLRYYLNRGFTEEVAKQMLSDRQRTFTLDKCIAKYGIEEGYNRWCERQRKWLSNYKRVNYSKISQELFISVYKELINVGFCDKVYFAKLDKNNQIHDTPNNYEFRLKLNNSYILPDFFIPSLNLILEFDGTYYHRDTPENKLREERRNQNIIDSGYSIIHITENEYNENKHYTVLNVVNKILKMKNS